MRIHGSVKLLAIPSVAEIFHEFAFALGGGKLLAFFPAARVQSCAIRQARFPVEPMQNRRQPNFTTGSQNPGQFTRFAHFPIFCPKEIMSPG
jgi:hypothetical protein